MNVSDPTEWHQESFGDPCRNVLLGHARRGSPVWLWTGYGVVCPDEVTTNGSAFVLLQSHGVPISLTPPGAAWFVGWAFYVLGRRCAQKWICCNG